MRFNSVKGGNFTSGAKAVNRSADQMFAASRESAPDFTGISKAAIASRTKERNAATQSQGLKDVANIKADNLIDRTKIKSDLTKSLSKTKQGKQRMAGVVGALGSIAGGFAMKSEKAAEKLDRQKQEARDLKRDEMMLAILNKPRTEFKFDETPPVNPGLKPEPKSDSTASTPTSTSTSTSISTPSPTSSPKISTSSTSTGVMTPQFKKIYDLAVKDGRSKFPEIVAAQAMHETGHLSPDISSVYNSSGGTNPFGQTGDRGYGTMTRQGDSSGWSKFPDLQTAVSDHITLWHDTGNHSENYNAHNSASDGLATVIPAYSPNSDPANQSAGFTESGYSASVKKILRDNGFNI